MKQSLGVCAKGLAAACFACATAQSIAQSYPVRPVRFIVPYAPGGGADIVARIVAQKLTDSLGQPFVIDNRGGAGTVIGTEMAAKATPDGHTIVIVTSTFTINPGLQIKLPYDPVNDFSPVTLLASTPYLVVVHPSVPASSIRELITVAKAKAGQLTYASVGNGSSTHLATEMFRSMAGISMVHVPYKGSAPALNDLLGGHVLTYFGSMPACLPQARAGRLKALAVTGAKRSGAAPDMPTIAEAGLPGYEFTAWYGVLAPSRTPSVIVSRLQLEMANTLKLRDVRERLAGDGSDPVGNTPAEFAAVIQADIRKYAGIIKQANIRAD